jgi:hypothetical protein
MSLNVIVGRTWRDQAENILVMDISLNGCDVTVGSVYGPNNTGREFYRFLNLAIGESAGKYKVIGGDWNTVLDPLPVQHNIDVINMAALPNQANSVLLREMCENKDLCDPYRVLYILQRETTRILPLAISGKIVADLTSFSSLSILYLPWSNTLSLPLCCVLNLTTKTSLYLLTVNLLIRRKRRN